MVLKRLSDNVSGRLRRHKASKAPIRARLLNRLGYKAFFLSRRKVSPDSSNSSDDEATIKTSLSLAPKLPPIPLPTETSKLPHPTIRVSYSEDLQGCKTKSCPVDVDGAQQVRFQTQVSVVEIPSRQAYSCQEKKKLWRSTKEIRFLARRNRREYTHDGSDWRRATEEEDMVHLGNGDYLHPHTHRLLQRDYKKLPTMSSRALEAEYESTLKRTRTGRVVKRPKMWI